MEVQEYQQFKLIQVGNVEYTVFGGSGGSIYVVFAELYSSRRIRGFTNSIEVVDMWPRHRMWMSKIQRDSSCIKRQIKMDWMYRWLVLRFQQEHQISTTSK